VQVWENILLEIDIRLPTQRGFRDGQKQRNSWVPQGSGPGSISFFLYGAGALAERDGE
jgi:hypothetical protein